MKRIEIRYSKRFLKDYNKAPLKLKSSFKKRLVVFQSNNYHPILYNHKLKGRFSGFRSISITGDWRALYSDDRSIISFHTLGTHSTLYS